MNVLVDTCVLSETKKPRPNEQVVQRLEALPPSEFYLSVLTLGELTRGLANLPPSRRRNDLEQWVDDIIVRCANRILVVDQPIAECWGELLATASAAGRQVPPVDALLAATALHHGMAIMTRNTADFEATGVTVIDPWADSA